MKKTQKEVQKNRTLRMTLMFILALGFTLIPLSASYGVTACPGIAKYEQPNGTVIEYTVRGDENLNWKESKDGSLILLDNRTGYFCYANRLFNHIYKSNAKVGIDKKPLLAATGAEYKSIRSTALAKAESLTDITIGINNGPSLASPITVPSVQPVLVLMINFSNVSSTAPTGYWKDSFFSNDVSSVNKYFKEVSYGATSLVPVLETAQTANDGIVSVTLAQEHPAVGGFSEDVSEQVPMLVRAALVKANTYVNFANYDLNGDGEIGTDELHISAVFAGGEAAVGGFYNSIWAHSWGFEPLSLDGKTVQNYIAAGENFADESGNPDTTPMTIGVFCHELGHSMGLPDLYDYGYDSMGVGGLSLMGSGAWGYLDDIPGKSPVHLDAWSKIALGFVTPTEALDGNEYILNEASNADYNVLKISDVSNPDQYFLIENRSYTGYDYGLYGFFSNKGIAIYHVDEEVISYAATHPGTFPYFNDNRFRKAVDVEEANQNILSYQELNYYGDTRDQNINPLPQVWTGYTFFAAGNPTHYNSSFSDETIPTAKYYSSSVDGTIVPPSIYDATTQSYWYYETASAIGNQNDASELDIEVLDVAKAAMRVNYNVGTYKVSLTASPVAGGTVSGGARVEPGTALTLRATPNSGYVFTGWSENGSTVSTDNPFVMQIDKNWNLTAEFKPINYTITFDSNGGTGSTLDSMAMTYDVSKQVPANTFTKVGYQFDGWSLTPDGTIVVWNQDMAKNLTTVDGATVTLYAHWRITTYSIFYHLWNGTNDVLNPTTYNYFTEDILLRPAERLGCKFLGWYSDINYTGLPVEVIPTGSMGTINLHAKWQPNTYSIQFVGNGGFGSMVDQAMAYDAPVNLAPLGFSKPGYHFLGWATTPTGPVVYKNEGLANNLTLVDGGVVSLYAKWEINVYGVNFNSNGGTSGVMNVQPITYDTSTALTANGYQKSGYSFLGWATSATGPVVYSNGASVKNLSMENEVVVVLYAKWGPPITSAVSYNYTSIKVSWAYAGSATSYRIYRATSAAGTYSYVYTASSTARSWVDTGQTTGKYYYYRVYPMIGTKVYVHTAYKYARAIPTTPTVTVAKYSTTSIKVTWSGVSGATRYQIYRATSPTGTYTSVYTASSTLRSWVNTGRTVGVTYYYKVRACHLEGSSYVYGAFSAVKSYKL